MSILKGSITGDAVYSELHSTTTNSIGLVNLVIGNGTDKVGDISSIDLGADSYYLKVEIDPIGGTNYVEMGTTQLLSVPYALYAKTVSDYSETDPVFITWDKDYDDLTNKPGAISDFSLDANNQNITNIAEPENGPDAATKAYVDALLARIETLEVLNIGFTDSRDGNHYDAVKIGDQIWMAKNLAYLPLVHSNTEFETQGNNSQPGYGVYGYDGSETAAAKSQANYTTYGVLYNWWAAMDGAGSSSSNPSGVQGVCPTGWHLPSDDEWTTLENYLIANGYNYDGTTTGNKIAKSLASTSRWTSSTNTGAVGNTDYPEKRNATGFTALPGGRRFYDGSFSTFGDSGYWWSATESDATNAWLRSLSYGNYSVFRVDVYKKWGLSVRCIKD